MKTTFSYFPGMFENPEPVKLFLKNKIKSNQNQFRSQKWLQHPFFNCVAMNSNLPGLGIYLYLSDVLHCPPRDSNYCVYDI